MARCSAGRPMLHPKMQRQSIGIKTFALLEPGTCFSFRGSTAYQRVETSSLRLNVGVLPEPAVWNPGRRPNPYQDLLQETAKRDSRSAAGGDPFGGLVGTLRRWKDAVLRPAR